MKNFLIVLLAVIVIALGGVVFWQYGNKPAANNVVQTATPSITLTSPNGGETIKEGSTYTIKWDSKNIPAGYKVSINIRRVPPPALQTEGQEFDPLIAVNLPDTGSYSWTVADMYPAGNYIIGVTSYAGTPVTNPISDESDAAFTIAKPVAAATTYTNSLYDYSVDYGADWTFREFPSTKTGAGFRPLSSPDEIASECIAVDASGSAENERNTPFADYVKRAAVSEIQNYEKLSTIETVTTASGLVGYKTTWVYSTMDGQKKISLPITYFELNARPKSGEPKTVQIRLDESECLAAYDQMIKTFRLGE